MCTGETAIAFGGWVWIHTQVGAVRSESKPNTQVRGGCQTVMLNLATNTVATLTGVSAETCQSKFSSAGRHLIPPPKTQVVTSDEEGGVVVWRREQTIFLRNFLCSTSQHFSGLALEPSWNQNVAPTHVHWISVAGKLKRKK